MAERLPSLLAFGPQTELPSAESLDNIREELITNPSLSTLKQAVCSLPQFWEDLLSFDTKLTQVPGDELLTQLRDWVEHGGPLPRPEGDGPNHFVLPITVLLQITQYTRYLAQVGGNAHAQVLQSVKAESVNGFCVGFLAATAVASAIRESDVGLYAAIALRLAVCIGAYVDLDCTYSPEAQNYRALAVRWRAKSTEDRDRAYGLIDSFSNFYISSINDDANITVTIKAADVSHFTEQAGRAGLRVTPVHVCGRFHTPSNLHLVDRIISIASTLEGMDFPDAKQLQVPVRSTADGKAITKGSLTRLALENALTHRADWFTTMKNAMGKPGQTVVVIGSSNCIPASLVGDYSPRIVSLSKLERQAASILEGDASQGHVPEIDSIHGVYDSEDLSKYPPHSIAIVGMAGKFPEADTIDELWNLLVEGRSTVRPADVDRLQLPEDTKWWGNFLDDPEAFDHKFFKKSSREALAWDPQQRVLLEVVYQALESAGYFGPSATEETLDYGCYIGAVMSDYYDVLTCHPTTAYGTVGTSRCFVSGCMSHYFGWTGPSLAIDTACSSSLVAINTACRAIWSGECSRAVAGGTNIISSPFDYQNLSAAGFLSPSGQCKPFDAGADGYCRGEAVAVVVLKRLSDAMRDHDNILGVITGSAANQNHNYGPITAPNSASQVDLYRKVMKLSGVEKGEVSYVEAHGTGTGVGDPIEVNSLRDAFGGPERDSTLNFTSIKGNIGHTEATAGVAGLVKVLLMMRNRQIPPQASLKSINPKIPAIDQHRMNIPRSLTPWTAKTLTACVNSYGAAGSNSTVIVRQAPTRIQSSNARRELSSVPLMISAGTPKNVTEYAQKLLGWLRNSSVAHDTHLTQSIAFNLADRANHSLPHMITSSISNIKDLEAKLEAAANGEGLTSVGSERNPIVLAFGGQESDFINLSKDIYESSKIFRQHLDSVNDLLVKFGSESFYPSIFQSEPIQNLVTLHSALFAVQYASAKSWMDCGLKVDAVVGHSFGQLTALCISGVLSLRDALKLVSGRASLMQKHWGPEPGSMLFVQASRHATEEILQFLKSGKRNLYAEIACYNGPESHVIVGSSDAIQFLVQHIGETFQGSVRTKVLNVTNGFHSQFTEPLLSPLGSLASQLEWKSPNGIHLETTDEFESRQELDSGLAAEHTRKPVFFQNAIERLVKKFPHCTFIEAGRGSSVMQLVKGSAADKSQGHTFLSPQLASSNAMNSLVDVTVNLWKKGYATQHWPFHRIQKLEYEYLSLPPIQFEKTRHWLGYHRQPLKEANVGHVTEEPITHELLTFLNFRDGSKKEAQFQIDPQSDRFQKMLAGHVMEGQTLCPASLYFEVVARAALYLAEDIQAAVYVPTVDDLFMGSPIGQSTSKKILLTMKKSNTDLSWSFSITTQDVDSQSAAPFEHSTGTVILKKRDDRQSAREFERFETLTGHRRWEQVMNDPDADKMKGKHIYRAWNTVVYYGEPFHGMKEVVSTGTESAGTVRILPDVEDPADQRLTDTPMTDSFMQFAGLLVNYFNLSSMDEVFVCSKIEHTEIGGGFDPDAGEWLVYATMSKSSETEANADAYVFDKRTKKMVMAVFGLRFSKMSRALLGRVLKGVNKGAKSDAKAPAPAAPQTIETTEEAMVAPAHQTPTVPTSKPAGKRQELLHILSNVTDVAVNEIRDTTTLEDLGIDSLMATEVLNDIRSVLGVTIDLSSFVFFEDIRAVINHVNEKLGFSGEGDDTASMGSPSLSAGSITTDPDATPADKSGISTPWSEVQMNEEEDIKDLAPSVPSIISARRAFEETRLSYDKLAETTQALDYWKEAYPHQARMVLAYVVEAFADLGVDVRKFRAGKVVPRVKALETHKRLVRQLYRILEDGKIVTFNGADFIRTNTSVDNASAESIYREIIDLYPQYANENKLTRAVGSEMAACLRGDKDGLQVVFGNREMKKTLEDMYEWAPLFRTPTLVLGDFLVAAFTHQASGKGKFRILEIGAGTGGTTRYLVKHLRSHGIEFEYVYTDISASLVSAASKKFKSAGNDEGLIFDVLNVEIPPKPEYEGAFHAVIASNTIHATKDLEVCLRHIRQMLREDGVLGLIEITRNQFWLDIVFGLFEGWQLFDDGREHATVDTRHWERRMKASGFGDVAWSDGASPESRTIQVVAAFPRASPAPPPEKSIKVTYETVVYKTIGNLEIHADVYYPAEGETLPDKPMPVALMIHGGSHMLFSRKDVRPAQTRLLVKKGFLPVSIDYRLCPEVTLTEGPMVDVCDALDWARHQLPRMPLKRAGLRIDGESVVAVGWSSGGQLAMSLGWTAPARGLRPPEANLVFYAPTDYEDTWWVNPIEPNGAPYKGQQYDVLEGVRDEPFSSYDMVGAWEEPITDPRSQNDARCRIVLHINWKAQTLPVILSGLPSRAKAGAGKNWDALPQPSLDVIRAASPRAHVREGTYSVPTFFIHGTADDLIPWEQSRGTYETMVGSGLDTEIVLLEDGQHICDLSSDPASDGWKAVLQGYNFICSRVHS
ncbi:beta-ketoacyl synthase domain-containing protein [Xylariaceae sp. FL0255]|nr:beta-ketoacyl synthase domain-containing protein [Xylariaceae sp. FL0255]